MNCWSSWAFIFSARLDESIKALGLEVLRTPVASPRANAIYERVIGTIRRECLDWLILLSEEHLRSILKEWVSHYNGSRVHKRLGPDDPDTPKNSRVTRKAEHRHHLAVGMLVLAKRIPGGFAPRFDRRVEETVGYGQLADTM